MKAKDIEDIYPLSPIQQGILFHTLYAPESGIYCEQFGITLHTPFDKEAFKTAWTRIIERHTILRTAFLWKGLDEPLQVVRPRVTVPWEEHDLRAISGPEQAQQMQTFRQADRSRGFDLSKAPLMRLTLFQLSQDTYHFHWSYHHLLLDGWSMALLLNEVFTVYQALLHGSSPILPQPRPYRNYIAWLQQQNLTDAEAFWRQRLAGFTSPTPLLGNQSAWTDKAGEEEGPYTELEIRFPRESTTALLSFANRHHLTLNTVMQGAWALLLSRYSGEADVVFGTIVSTRPSDVVGIETMIGLLINTLPSRVHISPTTNVVTWLAQIQEQQAEQRQYDYTPLAHIQQWSEVPPGQALFTSLLVFENYPVDASSSSNASLHIQDVHAVEWTHYPLTITVVPDTTLALRFSYQPTRFDAHTIQRLAGHFQRLLTDMLTNPHAPLAELAWLTDAEEQQILHTWHVPQRLPPQPSLTARFQTHVRQTPDAIAVTFEEEQLTYAELDARAKRLAHTLQTLGVGAETLVGLCLPRSLALVIGLLAILQAGGAYVPLDPTYPAERLHFMSHDAHLRVLLTDTHHQTLLDNVSCPVLVWETLNLTETNASSVGPLAPVRAEHLAYVIYTSGSTGVPKGVMVSHAHVSRLFAATQELYHFGPQDVWTLFHSYAFDFSVWELWGAWAYGGRLVVVPYWQSRDTERFVGLVMEQGVSVLNQTPSAFRQLVQVIEGGLAVERLVVREVIFGGEALEVQSVKRWYERCGSERTRLVNMYGITETTVHVSAAVLSEEVGREGRQTPIGEPLADLQWYVCDEGQRLVPIGVAGELYIGGAGVARGYLGRPELTAERFVPHPWSEQAGERLYRTGDVARYREDGTLEYVGRNDGQVKIRGYRIELGEIESVLCQAPGVKEAIVVVREDEAGNKRIVAYVVTLSQTVASVTEWRAFLGKRLPTHMVPAAFVVLEAFPLTPSGKLNHRALPAPENVRPTLGKAYVAPVTEAEQILAAIWAKVLGIAQVGLHDNFFELGGDSILSIQIVSKASAAGLHFTPRHLFQQQTIAQLVAVIDGASATQAKPDIVSTTQAGQNKAQGPVQLLPIQHWFFQQQLSEPHHWNQAVLLSTRRPLNPSWLQKTMHALLMHHDTLRLRAQHDGHSWHLTISALSEQTPFTHVDLTTTPLQEQSAAFEAAATSLQASLNLAEGPLVRMAYFELGFGQAARLLLIVHHLAIDIVSWSILLEDLEMAYQQISQGVPVRLPASTTPYRRWAELLHEYAQSTTLRHQLDFWLAQSWAEVHPLPLDIPHVLEENNEASVQTVVITFSQEETQILLSEVLGAYHTHIHEVLLTALLQAFTRWTGASSLLLNFEGHGREDLFEGVDLARTLGWFTTLVPVVLTLDEDQGPGESLKRIKEQLRRIPQHGIGYGLLRYLTLDEVIQQRLRALPQPEVSFNYAGRMTSTVVEEELFAPSAETVGAVYSPRNQRAHLLDINGAMMDGQLRLEWAYSTNRHKRATIEQLAQNYQEALRLLIRHCQSPQAGGYTPSDFPEAALSQSALDALVARLTATPAIEKPWRRTRSDIEAIYPLSPMQEGLLFHSLYEPQFAGYFEQVACVLHGTLDLPAFQKVWQHILERYPILRTLFLWEFLETPRQVVLQHIELPWRVQDWRSLPVQIQRERLQEWLRTDREQGFELSQAPLFRLNLIQLSDQTTHFTWSFHHLLLDGWSTSLVLDQALACLQQPFTLPPSRPYRDYITWLQQQDFSQAERFWRQTLRGFTTATPLGMETVVHPKADPEPEYREQVVQLPVTMMSALQTFARQQQLTLNTLIQGTWALLLARYSGESDVIFGVTVSGRPADLAGVEHMVGLFINTLPSRIRIEPRQQLLPWLRTLQEQQAEQRQYDYTPLAHIQQWSEVPPGQALFTSLLVFENYPADASASSNASLHIQDVHAVEWTHYPLTITVVPDTTLALRFSYQPTRFEARTIQRLAGHFQRLLTDMLTNPHTPLAELAWLTDAEEQQILHTWHVPQRLPPQPSLTTLFQDQVTRTPDAIAVTFEEEQLTYAELDARATHLAHTLQTLGVGAETLVGLCLPRSLALVIGLLAILQAGGAYVPLDPTYPADRLHFMSHDAHLTVLLTDAQHQELLDSVSCPVVMWETLNLTETTASSVGPLAPVPAEHLAYVIYTSGSTGVPKGVMVSHAHVSRLFAATQELYHFGPQDVWTLFHSYAFDFSVWELWGAWVYGGRLVVVPYWQSRDTERFVGLVMEQGVSVLNQTPSAFRQLVQVIEGGLVVERLVVREVIFGGEALDVQSVKRWYERCGSERTRLVNMYGITETTVHVSAAVLSEEVSREGRQTPIGEPLTDLQWYVCDEGQRLVPIGVAGELYIGGAGVARGYLGRPELTAERFVPHPWSEQAGERLYRTGDVARYREDGTLEYVGRNDGQVKIRGYRIELGEIESVLCQAPGVKEAVVVAREGMEGDKRLVAYVVVTPEATESSTTWRTFLRERLPDYMVPTTFLRLDTLPLTPSGKLDRRALPIPDQQEESATDRKASFIAPSNSVEETIAQIWSDVLHVQPISIHANFFELGGHSLFATQVISRVRAHFQIELPLRALFNAPTIAGLADIVIAGELDAVDDDTIMEMLAQREY